MLQYHLSLAPSVSSFTKSLKQSSSFCVSLSFETGKERYMNGSNVSDV